MKTNLSPQLIKKFLMGILFTSTILLIASCATNQTFLNSTVVPGATGSVKIQKDKNDNYLIKMQIFDLAKVERLQTSKTAYVVWLEAEGGGFENLGQLNSETGFLSKQRKASFKTTSESKPVRIFITAESESNVDYPNTMEVLTTDKFYK
jgi:hypothetical protein